MSALVNLSPIRKLPAIRESAPSTWRNCSRKIFASFLRPPRAQSHKLGPSARRPGGGASRRGLWNPAARRRGSTTSGQTAYSCGASGNQRAFGRRIRSRRGKRRSRPLFGPMQKIAVLQQGTFWTWISVARIRRSWSSPGPRFDRLHFIWQPKLVHGPMRTKTVRLVPTPHRVQVR